MKNKLRVLFVAVMISSTFLAACKKEDDDDNNNTTSDLCDGDGSNSYYPLTTGNMWKYTSNMGSNITIEVTANTDVFNGKTYNRLKKTELGTFSSIYLRKDSQGNIYRYWESVDAESLYLPANPVQGQTYDLASDTKMVASNIDTTITVSNSCGSYTNVVKYTVYYDTGEYLNDEYYKKGIGRVFLSQDNVFLYTEKIVSATLN